MNGIHDMGGMHGFGPVDVQDSAPFHAEWEIRLRALVNVCGAMGYIPNDDVLRRAIEEMSPELYLNSSYFARWEYSCEELLIELGFLTRAEIDARSLELNPEATLLPVKPSRFEGVRAKAPGVAGDPVQRFDVGNRVRVANFHPEGHTRAPRYVRGKSGVIQRCHGHELYPDTVSAHESDQPQVVYSVRFDGSELWGPSAEQPTQVSIDLWDSYLEPA